MDPSTVLVTPGELGPGGSEEARGAGGAPKNQLSPAQLCPEVGVPADAREGADRRSRAAPAQHSARAALGTAPAR